MAMGHVVLKEFFVDRQVPRFTEYVKRYTDLPFLLTLDPARRRPTCPASSSPRPTSGTWRRARSSRRCSSTPRPASRQCPNGSLGFRFGEAGKGRWNLDLGDVDPLLSLHGERRRSR